MTTLELNNRKYCIISEIMRIESEALIDRIEKIIKQETHAQSPLSFTFDELKQEIEEAEKETISYNHHEIKEMSWKK